MAVPSQRSRCVSAYIEKGFARSEAEQLCSKYPDDKPPAKSTKNPKQVGPPVGSLVATGSTYERGRGGGRGASEGIATATGWGSATGNLGTGAVVFPDPGELATSFEKSLGRPLKASDRDGWLEYTKRLSFPERGAQALWDKMLKSAQKTLSSALEDLKAVFGEAMSSGSTPVVSIFVQTQKMSHGGLQIEPPPNGTIKKIKDLQKAPKREKPDPSPITAPPASFPYRTKDAEKVWRAASDLILVYTTEPPGEIFQRALAKSGVKSFEITPEDEALLRMAIHYAQNGPPKSLTPIGGMNTTSASMKLRDG